MSNFDFFSFVLVAISTWRLTSLIVQEDGPYFIFLRLRMLVGIVYLNGSTPMGKKETIEIHRHVGNMFPAKPTNELARAMSCIWCASVWVGLVLATLNLTLTGDALAVFQIFIFSLAASGLAVKLNDL
jgi:hypothetical protein